MKQMDFSDRDKKVIKTKFIEKKMAILWEARVKEKILDYKSIAIIGKGAFGEVRLCKYIPQNKIVAVKKMNKNEM